MNKNTFSAKSPYSLPVILVSLAFLIALEIVLTRFLSINTPILRIGFGFLPVAIAGIIFGPVWAGLAYAAGDLLGMLIFPTGAYFPGFTLTAFLTGLVYGLLLYNKQVSVKRVVIAALLVVGVLNLGLDTLWLTILMGKGVVAMLPFRLLKVVVMVPIQTVLITFFWSKVLPRIPAFRASLLKADSQQQV